mmetsp:Transcript_4946/g.12412  ORF Transcript_4946/g.12412 Transcript_4946/m.12412 type:complete len:203 (-) Transcript_4946:497-1105(-)
MAAAVAGGGVGAAILGARAAAHQRFGTNSTPCKWTSAPALTHLKTRGVSGPGRPKHGACRRVVCMAAPKRVAMVGKQIEREIGTMLLTDKVLKEAVCPDRKRGQDAYLTALASVTEVDMSRDLQVAKVYISVYSDDEGKERAFSALKNLEGCDRGSSANSRINRPGCSAFPHLGAANVMLRPLRLPVLGMCAKTSGAALGSE